MRSPGREQSKLRDTLVLLLQRGSCEGRQNKLSPRHSPWASESTWLPAQAAASTSPMHARLGSRNRGEKCISLLGVPAGQRGSHPFPEGLPELGSTTLLHHNDLCKIQSLSVISWVMFYNFQLYELAQQMNGTPDV